MQILYNFYIYVLDKVFYMLYNSVVISVISMSIYIIYLSLKEGYGDEEVCQAGCGNYKI